MKLKITVQGVAYEVEVEVLEGDEASAPSVPLPRVSPANAPAGATLSPSAAPASAPSNARPSAAPAPPASGMVTSPIAGTVLKVECRAGDEVVAGQTLLLIEAMKMETAIAAPAAGRLKAVRVAAGDTVRENEVLVELE
jgi:biotin carboxyl carrier protein